MKPKSEPKPHGGARPGAGRPKSRALEHLEAVRAAELLIVTALPDVLNKLIEQAKGGDIGAAKLLLERVWGKAPTATRPLAEDEELPPDDPVRIEEEKAKLENRSIFASLAK